MSKKGVELADQKGRQYFKGVYKQGCKNKRISEARKHMQLGTNLLYSRFVALENLMIAFSLSSFIGDNIYFIYIMATVRKMNICKIFASCLKCCIYTKYYYCNFEANIESTMTKYFIET